jgi:hypothetical protein
MIKTFADFPYTLLDISFTIHDVEAAICPECDFILYDTDKIKRLFYILKEQQYAEM